MLFGLLVISLGTGRRRAMALVMEKTRELSHQALHDSLTGLPNRALVLDRAEQLLARASRNPGTYAGALFIDIDGFKHVNDNLGHAAGDQLLKVVGERLQSAVRDDDTVGRLGGDEFVVLACCGEGEETLNMLADRLTELLREPVELKDGRKLFSVTASIGVAIGRYDSPGCAAAGRRPGAVLRQGGRQGPLRAVRREHVRGREGQARARDRPRPGDRRRASCSSPTSRSSTSPRGGCAGVEALLRWQHPERGVICCPRISSRLAEDSGPDRADRPVGARERLPPGGRMGRRRAIPTNISVNVSARSWGGGA